MSFPVSVVILIGPAIAVSALMSRRMANRNPASTLGTVATGSITAFLTTVLIATGWMIVGYLFQAEKDLAHQKLSLEEGWILVTIIYGGMSAVAGFLTSSCFCFFNRRYNSAFR